MSMTSETLRLLITGDSDGAVQAFKKARDSADRDLGKAQDEAEKTSARLTKMGAASLAAGAVMVGALSRTIAPASDLNEAINVTGLTFGESAKEIEEWSKSAASALGLSRDQALSAASAIGGLLNNVGFMGDESVELSKDLVTLAADMGSAFNVSTTDALEAIRAGLAGEAEALKRFNVFMSEAAVNAKALELGLSDGTGALNENEKAQARLAIIMEQTSAIQGDFANTSDGAANSAKIAAANFRDFQAAIGTELLPIVSQALGALNGILGAFSNLPDPIKTVIGQTALWTTGLLLAGGAALTVAARVKALNVALSTMSTRLNMSKAAMLGWAGAAGVAVALQQEWSGARERSEAADRAATESIKQGASALENYTNVLNGLAASSPELQTALERVDGGAAGLAARFAESGDKGAALDEILAGLVENGGYVDGAFELAGTTVAAMANATDDVAAAAENANGSVPALAGSVDTLYRNTVNAAGAAGNLSGDLGRVYSPAAELRDVMAEVNDELDDFFGSIQSELELSSDFEAAVDDATAALLEHGGTLDADTEAGRNNIAARGDLIGSIEDTVDAMVDQGATTDEIVGKVRNMIAGFKDQAIEAGVSEDAIDDYTAALDEIPSEVETRLVQSGYDEVTRNAEYLKSLFDSMDGRQVTTFFVSVGGTGGTVQTNSGATAAEMDGDPNTTAENPTGQPRRGNRSFDMSGGGKNGGGSVNLTTVVELDGREIARSVERVSERDGGLRIKTRAGG